MVCEVLHETAFRHQRHRMSNRMQETGLKVDHATRTADHRATAPTSRKYHRLKGTFDGGRVLRLLAVTAMPRSTSERPHELHCGHRQREFRRQLWFRFVRRLPL